MPRPKLTAAQLRAALREHLAALGRAGGKKGGRKGGLARAKKLTPEQRSEISRRAAQARWSKRKK